MPASLHEARLATAAVAATLEKSLGLATVADVLRHYPRRYEDRTHFKPMGEVRHGEAVTICGRVVSADNLTTRTRMVITKVCVRDHDGAATLVFFNQWFVKKQFEKLIGREIVAFGRASRMGGKPAELSEVEWELVEASEDPSAPGLATNRIVPVYPLAEGVKQPRLRRLAWDALALAGDQIEEHLPAAIRERYDLEDAVSAVRQMHFPDSFAALESARRRLVFDEFFAMQLALAQHRRDAGAEPGIEFAGIAESLRELTTALPFSLTGAQERVIAEIGEDMAAPRPMNRLLQGDVGSGKTVVAVAALLIAARAGYQAALMAPTEILAEQHYESIRRTMETLGIPITLLTGSIPKGEKADRAQCIADGYFPVVVGTHALIQENIAFQRLGLAIVDEQHRFGVLQRAALRDKSASHTAPDVLVMTATPIPRTLTLTVYGDLDVSVVDELPPGRKPIKTHWKRGADRPQVYETLRGLIAQGRQAYVICPLIEESDKLQARAATDLAAHLANDVFPDFRVGLLHGQMRTAERDAVMDDFRAGGIHILVSTTVIEVGVDVPNASIIVIEDAERFGLAQLHQLRGRVGRGSIQSYCLLIADPKSPEGAARMETMARTCDGFEIAEVDLQLRGPGDFYGTRQSGVEMLPFLDVVKDVAILNEAREAALAVIAADPALDAPRHRGLQAILAKRQKRLSPAAGAN